MTGRGREREGDGRVNVRRHDDLVVDTPPEEGKKERKECEGEEQVSKGVRRSINSSRSLSKPPQMNEVRESLESVGTHSGGLWKSALEGCKKTGVPSVRVLYPSIASFLAAFRKYPEQMAFRTRL